jgi:hypothetical protein
VLDVEIGGMSRTSAIRVLQEQLGPRAEAPLQVAVAGQTVQLDPVAAGIRLDAAATVGNSGGQDWRPNRLIAALFADKEVDPVVTVDEDRLGVALKAVAAGVDKPAREGDVVFTSGKAVAVAPVPGTRLDLDGSAAAVRAAFLRTPDVVTLPTEVVEPKVGAPEVERAMAEFATPAMSAPVTVSAAGREVALPPAKLAPALAMTPDAGGRLQPAVDGVLLAKGLVAQD